MPLTYKPFVLTYQTRQQPGNRRLSKRYTCISMQERRHQNQNGPKITPIQIIQGICLSRVIPNQASVHQGHYQKNIFSDTAICIRLLGNRNPKGRVREELGSGIFGYLYRKETESPKLLLEQRMDLSRAIPNKAAHKEGIVTDIRFRTRPYCIHLRANRSSPEIDPLE